MSTRDSSSDDEDEHEGNGRWTSAEEDFRRESVNREGIERALEADLEKEEREVLETTQRGDGVEEARKKAREKQQTINLAKSVGVELSVLPPRSSDEEDRTTTTGWDNETEELDQPDSIERTNVGKMEGKKGIKLLSAGGWSLEVFPGDYVVHRKYGIGRFEGTVLKDKKGEETGQMSAMVVEYADSTVHVPIERAYRLSRYRAGDAAVKPRLSRIKGEAWSKAKRRVALSTARLAQDVLALYARRETLSRKPFDPDVEGEKMEAFSSTFPYEPTRDQKNCFQAVENDMVWRKRPMDRLICGDVGFGKTEVALRALFRCVANGRQAALLAPTGVLASQHFKTIKTRMVDTFGIETAMLRGGMGPNTKPGREIRERIASGDVDLIVGTHAILSNGLKFHDLGLLVIDEEQRFGVNQKERLKIICDKVDVLTLSATPIPRTLQMSLTGIRDTSTLRSPPPMRKATVTHVEPFSEEIIYRAIQEELNRGGQCYYVVPRITMLEEAHTIVERLFPDAEVICAHGRMPRRGAEENVAKFAEGKAQILIATTVIENGVDIPTVNTIVIQNAQMFGMSTLYQLRGRVGRSDQQAHCYFLHKEQGLTEQSIARLQTMADLSNLGSGFEVANRDLEIRGAGSLLGTEQSGLAGRVGFDLYMKMLKSSIRQLRALDLPTVPRTTVFLPENEGQIDGAFALPPDYVPDVADRTTQEGLARLAETTEALVQLTTDWKTNYGPLPVSVQSCLKTLHLHVVLRQLGIDLVGLVPSKNNRLDGVLRSAGLRPRHWARICASLPKKLSPKGVAVVFPARYADGKRDLLALPGSPFDANLVPEEDDDRDAADDRWGEEVLGEVDRACLLEGGVLDGALFRDFPRIVLPDLGARPEGTRAALVLKLLLPAVKVVAKKQKQDKEKAKLAAEIRDKRENMKRKSKAESIREKSRNGYYY